MSCPLKRRKDIPKHVVKQLSEHLENATICMKVILVGKPLKLLRKISVIHWGVQGWRLCFCMCESGFSVMWSIGLMVQTFIHYNQSNKRYQVGNTGQFCSILHHVSAGSMFSYLWTQCRDFKEERLGWNLNACVFMKSTNKRVIDSVGVQMLSHWHSSVHLGVCVFERRGVSLGPLTTFLRCRCLCVLIISVIV